MLKQAKRAAVAGIFVLTGTALPLMASAASGNTDFPDLFWSEVRMKAMDTNKDGMVSREEYMAYMGAQYDKMDQKKAGKLSRADWLNKKMMSTTFVSPQSD
jgi:hypothetical protein